MYNRPGIHFRILSPLRFVVRKIANWQIPKYLSKHPRGKERDTIEGLIVSFTSFPARIDKVWLVVECLKRQTWLPEKIILWLSKEQFPKKACIPLSLRSQTDDIFEIRMVEEDLKSHKKYYYAVQEYPNKRILLVDDDIYYPTNMIEDMWKATFHYPDAIICRYGSLMTYEKERILKKYREWEPLDHPSESKNIFFGSGGGTLIQPWLLYSDLTKKELFMELTPTADDVWLNAMADLAKVKIVKISTGLFCPILQRTELSLYQENIGRGQNDIQIGKLIAYYESVSGVKVFQNKSLTPS